MLQRFCQYITQNQLFLPSDKILLTVSGGIDSVVMAHLFQQTAFNFAIAHCNFNLRGKESDEDEKFVSELAGKYHVKFYNTRFNTGEFASQNGISIQMAARELRYEWFYQLIKQEGFDYFATAHHLNDVIESVLLNLSKGTGVHGLIGINRKAEKAIRPLLDFSRDEIISYASEKNLFWREDSSNSSSKYQRNFIRNEVVPLLKKINPSLEQTFQESIEKIRSAEKIFSQSIEQIKNKICHFKGEDLYINIQELEKESESGLILLEILGVFGFTYTEIKNLLHSIQVGKRIESVTHVAVRDREDFIVSPNKKHVDQNWKISKDSNKIQTSEELLSFRQLKLQDWKLNKSSEYCYLDLNNLQFPLTVRNWKEGDWFIPFGLGQKKKVSDLLVDLKIPFSHKKAVKVLVSGESIVWIIGYRSDDRYKITEQTRDILEVKVEKL
jgi:tRNA(Ile)-lysidine synthase